MFGPFYSGNNYNDDNYDIQYYPNVVGYTIDFYVGDIKSFGAGLVLLTIQLAKGPFLFRNIHFRIHARDTTKD